MNDTCLITEEKNERLYFTMIPNIVTEMGLSVYAQSLYLRLKRRAGESGECFESTRNLAIGCKMSTAKVTEAKRELEQAGLIRIETAKGEHGGRPYHIITITNIWEKNLAHYSQVCRANLQVSPGKLASLPHATKEESIKKKGEERAATSAARVPFSGENGINAASLKSHPAIQAIKKITGYYPPKNLYERIVDLVGEEPDVERLKYWFDTWTAKNQNPQDFTWLFEWYREDGYYLEDSRKIFAYSKPDMNEC